MLTIREIETRIMRAAVKGMLDAGFTVDLNDGEETAVKAATTIKAVMAEAFATDEDYLIARRKDGTRVGAAWFIHGNGCDVLSDYTANDEMEKALALANAAANRLDGVKIAKAKPAYGSATWCETYSDDLGESPDY